MGTSQARTVPLGFTGERVPAGTHFCYIFNDDAERLEVMARFVESGINAGEKVVYVADTMPAQEFLRRLQEMGVNIDAAPGELSVWDAPEVYNAHGPLRPDEMLRFCRTFAEDARDRGFTGSRGVGEMTWCLKPGGSSLTDVLEYETRLNHLLEEHPSTICCQYDARKFSGEMLMDVLYVHPAMVIRGQLVHNPFYMEPDKFLAELRSRNKVPDAVRASAH